jgi:predicted outer membrane repeat protein
MAPLGSTVTVSGTVMSCSLTLPSYTITLKGDGGGDDGFDGTAGPSTPILSGMNVQTTTIKNLFFRNAAVFSSGAAISITGTSSPTIDQAVFIGNVANNNGGAVSISQAGGSPNSPVIITDSTFGGASPNFASSGGALHIYNVTGLFLSGNAFIGNTATTTGAGCSSRWLLLPTRL